MLMRDEARIASDAMQSLRIAGALLLAQFSVSLLLGLPPFRFDVLIDVLKYVQDIRRPMDRDAVMYFWVFVCVTNLAAGTVLYLMGCLPRRWIAQDRQVSQIGLALVIGVTLLTLGAPAFLCSAWMPLKQHEAWIESLHYIVRGFSMLQILDFQVPGDLPMGVKSADYQIPGYQAAFREVFTHTWISSVFVVLPMFLTREIGRIPRETGLALGFLPITALIIWNMPITGRSEITQITFFYLVLVIASLFGRRLVETLKVVERASDERRQAVELAEDALHALREENQRSAALMNEQLQRLESRSTFFASVVHELRQPLKGLDIYGNLLQRALQDPRELAQARSYLHTMIQERSSLARTFEGMLALAKVTARQQKPNIQPERLLPILKAVERQFTAEAENAGLRMQIVMPSQDVILKTDEFYLTTVLNNFITNAIKNTKPVEGDNGTPEIRIRVRVRGGRAIIYVIDRGCGIAKTDCANIFEPGYQAGILGKGKKTGHGFGLAIVKSIVDNVLPDHAVGFRSIYGRGSHFMVDVPIYVDPLALPGEDGQGAVSDIIALKGACVAVVEDDAGVRDSLVAHLECAGIMVYSASTLRGMLDILERLETERFPDLIVTSHLLPQQITSRQVIEAVRKAGMDAVMPALVITTDHNEAIFNVSDLTAVEVLQKPFTTSHIMRRLASSYEPPAPLDDWRGGS